MFNVQCVVKLIPLVHLCHCMSVSMYGHSLPEQNKFTDLCASKRTIVWFLRSVAKWLRNPSWCASLVAGIAGMQVAVLSSSMV